MTAVEQSLSVYLSLLERRVAGRSNNSQIPQLRGDGVKFLSSA